MPHSLAPHRTAPDRTARTAPHRTAAGRHFSPQPQPNPSPLCRHTQHHLLFLFRVPSDSTNSNQPHSATPPQPDSTQHNPTPCNPSPPYSPQPTATPLPTHHRTTPIPFIPHHFNRSALSSIQLIEQCQLAPQLLSALLSGSVFVFVFHRMLRTMRKIADDFEIPESHMVVGNLTVGGRGNSNGANQGEERLDITHENKGSILAAR